MKKGRITFILQKTWQDKKFHEFKIEDDPITYSNWQDQFSLKKVGDDVEFEAEQKGQNWKATLSGTAPKASGGGYRPISPEQQAIEKLKLRQMIVTMSASYAKDLVVAVLQREQLQSGAIRTLFSEFAEAIYQFNISHIKEV